MPYNYSTGFEKAKAAKAAYSRGALLKATSRESKSARKVELVDPSNNILDQLISDDVLPSLTLNSRIEMLDVSPIEVTYCEVAIEQHPIYLILDTGSSKSLASHEFLKKIRKKIDKLSIRNLIDVHGQRKYLLGVVESPLIVISKVEMPIDVEELGIEKELTEDSKLEKEQQVQIKKLLKKYKDLFAEGLTQLGRMKEEVYKIVMKEGAEPIK
ncbi:26257_t:CDS:2 [Gigaspora margarita]|uniref:26257_t:CDS:1 n=1 Tax=Gigaspora margarita TaxID=4874 RepID=A0ABM8VZT0_GIGMA|nr:26257_t:CDS:2 [Gigaspora margarita]